MSHFEKQPQDTKVTLQSPLETKVAAFKPMLPQTPEAEQLANLQQQFRHLSNMIIGNQSIAAYEPTPRENYHGNSREDEIARLREETHHLKTELKDLKSQKAKEVERYDRTQTSQEMTSALSRALEEIRRMQSRMDGFMRTYATGNHRHHQQQVPIHEGRPLCDICGKIGHVSQYCFHRFQQSQRYWEPRTTQNSRIIPEHEPIIATYEQEASPRIQPSPDQSKNKEQDERVYYARRSQPIPHTLVNAEIPTINTINAVTSSSPNKTKEPKKPQSEFKMPDFDTISPSLQAEDAFVKAHPENDKQEIVVRIKICTENSPAEVQNTAVMTKATRKNLTNEQSTSATSFTPYRKTAPSARVQLRHNSTQVKSPSNLAETLDPLRKQARQGKGLLPTKSPRSATLSPKQEQRNAFVTAEILGYPVDLLVDSGACISVIVAEFVKEVFSEETTPIMAPSTYSRVDTVSGENLPTVGMIEVTLSFNGREFPCQFHVVENMTTSAVLGRGFLLTNDAIINFSDGTLTLDNSHTVELSLKAKNSKPLPPMANLLKAHLEDNHPANQHYTEETASILSKYHRNWD